MTARRPCDPESDGGDAWVPVEVRHRDLKGCVQTRQIMAPAGSHAVVKNIFPEVRNPDRIGAEDMGLGELLMIVEVEVHPPTGAPWGDLAEFERPRDFFPRTLQASVDYLKKIAGSADPLEVEDDLMDRNAAAAMKVSTAWRRGDYQSEGVAAPTVKAEGGPELDLAALRPLVDVELLWRRAAALKRYESITLIGPDLTAALSSAFEAGREMHRLETPTLAARRSSAFADKVPAERAKLKEFAQQRIDNWPANEKFSKAALARYVEKHAPPELLKKRRVLDPDNPTLTAEDLLKNVLWTRELIWPETHR